MAKVSKRSIEKLHQTMLNKSAREIRNISEEMITDASTVKLVAKLNSYFRMPGLSSSGVSRFAFEFMGNTSLKVNKKGQLKIELSDLNSLTKSELNNMARQAYKLSKDNWNRYIKSQAKGYATYWRRELTDVVRGIEKVKFSEKDAELIEETITWLISTGYTREDAVYKIRELIRNENETGILDKNPDISGPELKKEWLDKIKQLRTVTTFQRLSTLYETFKGYNEQIHLLGGGNKVSPAGVVATSIIPIAKDLGYIRKNIPQQYIPVLEQYYNQNEVIPLETLRKEFSIDVSKISGKKLLKYHKMVSQAGKIATSYITKLAANEHKGWF